MRKKTGPINEWLHWDDLPETVNPKDYIQQMIAADTKPGDARKRALSNLRYAKKTGWVTDAPSPNPTGHVFTVPFYRWLLYQYPNIQGLPRHSIIIEVPGIAIPLALGAPSYSIWQSTPVDPEEHQRIKRENERLRGENAELKRQLAISTEKNGVWEERDRQRRRNCGRRSTEK